MKVFNLTDVKTKKLEQHHALDQVYVINGASIPPGGSISVDDAKRPVVARDTLHLVGIGAVALDKLPEEYVKQKASSGPSPSPATTPSTTDVKPGSVPATETTAQAPSPPAVDVPTEAAPAPPAPPPARASRRG